MSSFITGGFRRQSLKEDMYPFLECAHKRTDMIEFVAGYGADGVSLEWWDHVAYDNNIIVLLS